MSVSSHLLLSLRSAEFCANPHPVTVKPNDDPKVKGDPLRTLFVGRLSYEATEDDLRKAFGQFGRIQSVRLIHDQHLNCTKANKSFLGENCRE